MRERTAGPRNGRAFALGQALAVAFLAACLFRVWREVGLILPRDLITKSLGFAEALQSRLGLQVGAFLAALLVLHALLGALAYGLGRLTRAAFPQIASWWLPTTAWFFAIVGFVLAANAGFFPASIFAGTGAEWPGHPAPFSPVALAGIAVNTLGHNHPRLVRALTEQIGRIIHSSNLFQVPLQEQAADRIAEITGLDEVFFCNSGLEANEAAIKVARKYGHDRGIAEPAIIVMEKAFHGRSLATLSATASRTASSCAPSRSGAGTRHISGMRMRGTLFRSRSALSTSQSGCG